jgi:dTDP-glucose 4,6-dehydratase
MVTGGAGFIGSNFIRLLMRNEKQHEVVNFDALTYAGNLANLEDVGSERGYKFIRGNICDAQAVASAMRGCDAVVHFAAESHVDRSIYEPSPAIQTNITGTFVLLEAARKLVLARFVQVSTDEVYGDIAAGKFAEESYPLKPSSPYSASKAAGDLLALSYVRTYGVPVLITRSSNNYGPYQFLEKFLPLMITNALAGCALPLYGDGAQQRDWVHVNDNCQGILKVLEQGKVGEVYNIGGHDVVDNLSMAKKVLRLLDKPESLITHVEDRPGHDRRCALDSTKAMTELGWKPEIKLEEGLRETIGWYGNNTKWIEALRAGEYRQYYQKYYESRADSLKAIAQRQTEIDR